LLPRLLIFGGLTLPASECWRGARSSRPAVARLRAGLAAPISIGRAWAELMQRVGYTRCVAQGGDRGAFAVDQMGLHAQAGLLAIHTNMPATLPADVDGLGHSSRSTTRGCAGLQLG
jgi:hypothetical protein